MWYHTRQKFIKRKIMKISYHRHRKIKTRRIALSDLILRGIEESKDLANELKVTLPTIKKILY